MRDDARRILVVEGNDPETLARAASVGIGGAAERYGAVLSQIDPRVSFSIARPSEPDFDAAAVELDGVSGVALTGSGVAWSADAREAAPHHVMLERAFAAGIPVFGSCWGLQVGAVALGGAVGWGAAGLELGVARAITLTEAGRAHPMFAGKPSTFDSVCIHRDEVTRAPQGARVLAGNAHSAVQAIAYEAGGVRFWGVQYHPELTLGDIGDYLATPGRSSAFDDSKFRSVEDAAQVIADLRAIGADPASHAPLRWRYGVSADVSEPSRLRRELANWLCSLAPAEAASVATDQAGSLQVTTRS
ncbi:MAG: type 1 glutamine amidotransferase [Pseudomonadota bacterium]